MKRVVLSFNESTFYELELLKKEQGYQTWTKMMSRAIALLKIIDKNKDQGYTEIILRNHKEKIEKEIILPY